MDARRLLGIATAIVIALLVPTSSVHATTVTPEDFFSTLSQEIARSGVFDRHTTLTYRSLEYSESLATPEPIVRTQVVNADGSLTSRRTTLGRIEDVRCPRLDQCWQRTTAKGSNHDWHALPAGVVYYSSTRSNLFDWAREFQIDKGWDISEGPRGSRVFTFTYPAGTSTGVMRWTVARRLVTMTWVGIDAAGNQDVMASLRYVATSKPTPIARPAAADVGPPVSPTTSSLDLDVFINR
jgi:hypothetical protein